MGQGEGVYLTMRSGLEVGVRAMKGLHFLWKQKVVLCPGGWCLSLGHRQALSLFHSCRIWIKSNPATLMQCVEPCAQLCLSA